MKKIFTSILFLFIFSYLIKAQTGVSISTNNADPHPSSMLDIQSNTKGLLIPRMSETERLAINSPAIGLLVYQNSPTQSFYYYNGTIWTSLLSSDLPSYVETDPQVGVNTTNYLSKWSGAELISSTIFDNGNVGIGTNLPGQKLEVTGNFLLTNDDAWIGSGSTIERIEFDKSMHRIKLQNADIQFDNNRWIGLNASGRRLYFSSTFTDRISIKESNIEIDNDKWIGTGSTTPRIHFVNNGTDNQINFVSTGGDFKVGIGTASPVSRLDVYGTITCIGGNSDQWNEAYSWGKPNLLAILTQGNDAGNKEILNVKQIGIGTTNPPSSAAIEINSTNQGILFPRMTSAQRNTISNPEEGLEIYNTSRKCKEWFTGTEWTSNTPAGTIVAFGGTSIPAGWLLCDGSIVSRNIYTDLFSKITTAFGSGDGSTTFHLPDLRGKFLRGVDGSAGNDPDKLSRTASNIGGNVGNNVGSSQTDELKSHNHTLKASTTTLVATGSTSTETNSGNENSGTTGGNETRPKNVNVNYIIKY